MNEFDNNGNPEDEGEKGYPKTTSSSVTEVIVVINMMVVTNRDYLTQLP